MQNLKKYSVILIISWHESEDVNQKSLLPKFQLIPIPGGHLYFRLDIILAKDFQNTPQTHIFQVWK